ncbi:hypothetical protein T492DRAFT_898603, partial [Pavlovales sp. CCMP2436]
WRGTATATALLPPTANRSQAPHTTPRSRSAPRRGPAARTTQGGKTAALLPPTANRRQTLRPERCAVPAALAAAWSRCRAPEAASSGAHLRPTRRVHLAHQSGRSRTSLRLSAPLWGCSRVDALDTRPGRRLCPPPTPRARPARGPYRGNRSNRRKRQGRRVIEARAQSLGGWGGCSALRLP